MKRCIECGCLMDDTHESDVCEICTEEMGGLSSDRVRAETTDEEDEESLYPTIQWPKENPFLTKRPTRR